MTNDNESTPEPRGVVADVVAGKPVHPNIRQLKSIYDPATGKLRPNTTAALIADLIYSACSWLIPADYPAVHAWAQLEIRTAALEAVIEPAEMGSGEHTLTEMIKAAAEIRALRRSQTDLADRLLLYPKERKEHELGEDSDDADDDLE